MHVDILILVFLIAFNGLFAMTELAVVAAPKLSCLFLVSFGDASPEAIKRMIKDKQKIKEQAKEEMVKSE